MKPLLPTAGSDPFYTATAGRLTTTERRKRPPYRGPRTGRVVGVAPSGRTVWKCIHPPHDDTRVPFVVNGTRYDLTRADVADRPCASVDSAAD